MPLYKKYQKGDVTIALWRIAESEDALSALVDGAMVAELANLGYGSAKRRVEWLAVRALLAHLFGEGVRVKYNSNGRPFTDGFSDDISISHTNGWAAVAISKNRRVGIDVELVSRKASRTSSHFIHEEQLAAIDAPSRDAAALLCWVAKEALFKVVGDLGGNFKDNISVAPFKVQQEGVMSLSIVGLPFCDESDFRVLYFFDNDVVIALAEDKI